MTRYRFTTTLKFGMLAGWLLVAGYQSQARADDANAIAAIEKAGGSVRQFGGDNAELEIEFHLRGRKLTDAGLRHIATLKNVVSLNLRDTKVSSQGLVHLAGLTKLRNLHLERTAVGDEGIEHLAGLVNLEYLNLYSTNITDKSLPQLKNLKNLRRLFVWKTGVTDQGLAGLKQSLPGLKIFRGVDLSKLPADFPTEPETKKPTATLTWVAVSSREQAPEKSLNGINTTVFFENKSKRRVKIYWIAYGGELKLYGELAPGATRRQNTYAKNYWLIADENDKPLGYFVVKAEESLALIPK